LANAQKQRSRIAGDVLLDSKIENEIVQQDGGLSLKTPRGELGRRRNSAHAGQKLSLKQKLKRHLARMPSQCHEGAH
jgi:hypothetical protein